MPAYRFEALNAAGKSSSGLLEADNAKAARAQLRAQALVPLEVTPVVAGNAADTRIKFGRRVFSTTSLSVWTRQLAGLVGLRTAARARADSARRRGRGRPPARTGGAPEERGQRRLAVRARAGQLAARVRRRLPRGRRRRRAKRRARRRARAPGRRPGGTPGPEGQADRRDRLPGDRLADRLRDRRSSWSPTSCRRWPRCSPAASARCRG